MKIESSIAEALVATTSVLLDEVDFTQGNCKQNDQVGAVVRVSTLQNARATVTAVRGVLTALAPKRCTHDEPDAGLCERCIANALRVGKIDDWLRGCPFCESAASTRSTSNSNISTMGCHNGNCHIRPQMNCEGVTTKDIVKYVKIWNTRA